MQPQFAFFFLYLYFSCSNYIFNKTIIVLLLSTEREVDLQGGQRGDKEMVMVRLRVWECENIAVRTLIRYGKLQRRCAFTIHVYSKNIEYTWTVKAHQRCNFLYLINVPTAMFSCSHTLNRTITISLSPLCPPHKSISLSVDSSRIIIVLLKIQLLHKRYNYKKKKKRKLWLQSSNMWILGMLPDATSLELALR